MHSGQAEPIPAATIRSAAGHQRVAAFEVPANGTAWVRIATGNLLCSLVAIGTSTTRGAVRVNIRGMVEQR